MKILKEYDKDGFHYVLKEISPGHTTLGKYPIKKEVPKKKKLK